MPKYKLGFSLYHHQTLDRVLINGYVFEVNDHNQLLYYKGIAIRNILDSYQIDVKNTPYDLLLKYVEELNIQNIEAYFNKGKKQKIELQTLYTDLRVKQLLQSYIDHRVDAFLTLAMLHNIDICWQIERKIRFEDVRLHFYEGTSKAVLHFEKTQTGVNYLLKLVINDQNILPKNTNLNILNNQPGWICIQNQILKLESINGLKLKPFLTKENIFIPNENVKTFIEKFLFDVLHKTEIESDGLVILQENDITQKVLMVKEDFIANTFVLEVLFYYHDVKFNYSDVSAYKNKLLFDEQNEIMIKQTTRNTSEELQAITFLCEKGLSINASKRLSFGKSKYDVIAWINQNLEDLKDFVLAEVDVEQKKIKLTDYQLNVNSSLDNDWFDIYGTISFGEAQFPIVQLFPYIKSKNQFFPIGNGYYYLIPMELMAQYENLAMFGKEENNRWRLPKSHYQTVEKAGIEPPKNLVNNLIIANDDDIAYTSSPLLKAELRPYQLQGVKWLIKHRLNGLGALLADDMGLGKTLQTIAALLYTKESLKKTQNTTPKVGQLSLFDQSDYQINSLNALIILPASLVFNWHSEIKKFAPSLHLLNYTGPKRLDKKSTIHTFDIVLTTYKVAINDIEILKNIHFEYVILDESQQIKNKDGKSFKLLSELNTKSKISLSGTPIENSLSDLWTQMQFINPDILGSYSFFENKFVKPIRKNNDQETKDTLKALISPFILRRTKEQVAPELPEMTKQIHYSEMEKEQKSLFEKEKSAARNLLLSMETDQNVTKVHILTALLRLRQLANHPVLVDKNYTGKSGKFEDIKNEISTVIKANHKLLIFSAFKSMLYMLESWLIEEDIKYTMLTGDHLSAERQNNVEQFQSDEHLKVFLISIKAGGVGLNLTQADYVFILDPWWNPFIEKQAEARAHRIGQKNKVTVKKFITKDSIEEKILILQDKKQTLANELISEDLTEYNLSMEEIKDLLT